MEVATTGFGTFIAQSSSDARLGGVCQEGFMYTLEVHKRIGSELLREIGQFRVAVWKAEGATFFNAVINKTGVWTDDVDCDPETLHWTIRSGDELIAAARLSIHHDITKVPDFNLFATTLRPAERPVASLNRLVVRKEYRGQGLGTLLDVQRIELARQFDARILTLEAVGRLRAEQLVRLGFTIRAVHAFDPDMSFEQPRSFYALTGHPDQCGSTDIAYTSHTRELSDIFTAVNSVHTSDYLSHSFKVVSMR